MSDKLITEKHFRINEALSLKVKYFDNGDGVVFENQKLVLAGNFDDASINLYGSVFTPEQLRKLADELESANTLVNSLVNNKP